MIPQQQQNSNDTKVTVNSRIIQRDILLKQDYKIYNSHSYKNTDGLVNMLASNLVILNQSHRVAWLIGQTMLNRSMSPVSQL